MHTRLLRGATLGVVLVASSGCVSSAPPAVAPATTAASGAGVPPVRRTLVATTPAGVPGWTTRLYLIEYGPGVSAPLHSHPEGGSGWVIEGSFESGFGDETVTTVRPSSPVSASPAASGSSA